MFDFWFWKCVESKCWRNACALEHVHALRQHFDSTHFRNQNRKSIIFELFIDDIVCVFVDFMCMWFHNLVIGCRYFWAIPFNNQMETARLPFNIENQYRVRSLCLLFFIVLFSVRRAEWKRSAIPTMLCYLISVVVFVIGMPIAAGCWLVLCMRILYIFWGITIGRCIISCDKCCIFNTHDSHDSRYCGGSYSNRNEPTSASCRRKEIVACARLRKTAQRMRRLELAPTRRRCRDWATQTRRREACRNRRSCGSTSSSGTHLAWGWVPPVRLPSSSRRWASQWRCEALHGACRMSSPLQPHGSRGAPLKSYFSR